MTRSNLTKYDPNTQAITTSKVYALRQAKIALEKALIELEYAQQQLRAERMLPRLDAIAVAKSAAHECALALAGEC